MKDTNRRKIRLWSSQKSANTQNNSSSPISAQVFTPAWSGERTGDDIGSYSLHFRNRRFNLNQWNHSICVLGACAFCAPQNGEGRPNHVASVSSTYQIAKLL